MAQAMVKRKINLETPQESENIKPSTKITMTETYTDKSKTYSNVNLLATVYPLNNSGTKRAFVGLHYNQENKTFLPSIQLTNNQNLNGLTLDSSKWCQLQNCFQDICSYFKPEDNHGNTPSKIQIEDIDLTFTTSYGTKSIIFDKQSNCENDAENKCKRRKNYSPAIIMQKTTFYGLKNATVCIDERLKRIQRIVEQVNACKDYILQELTVLVNDSDLRKKNSDFVVKNILHNNMYKIKNIVKDKFDISIHNVFLEFYFDIVYFELVVLHSELFYDELVEKQSNEFLIESQIM